MAQGLYLGAGGVKDLKSCYVGAGGVKQVKYIYIGQNGSVRLVWPSFIYRDGDIGSITGGINYVPDSGTYYATYFYDTGSYLECGVNMTSEKNGNSDFYGGYCYNSIDLSPYSKIQATFYVTKGCTIVTTSPYSSSLFGLFICTSNYFTLNSYGRLNCNGTYLTCQKSDYALNNSYVTDYCWYLFNSTSGTAGSTYTLALDVSSYKSNCWLAFGAAAGSGLGSPNNFNIQISEIDLIV